MKYDSKQDQTLDETVEEYLKTGLNGKAESTKQTYRSHIREFRNWIHDCNCGWVNGGTKEWSSIEDCVCDTRVDNENYSGDPLFRHLDIDELEDWIAELADTDASPQTIQKAYYAVMGMLKSEHPDGITNDDGFNLAKKKYISGWDDTRQTEEQREQIPYLTPEEVQQLVANVPGPTRRNQLIVRLLWQLGIRQSDLVELRVDGIDVEEQEIKMWDVKNSEPRDIYFGESIKPLVRFWLEKGRQALSPKLAEESEYLVYGDKSPQMNSKTINDKIIRPAADAAGLQGESYTDTGGKSRASVTGHILRHSFARKFVLDGGDIKRLKKILGHSDISTTEKYLVFKDDEIKDARKQYGPQ